jgi:hypothetical protein
MNRLLPYCAPKVHHHRRRMPTFVARQAIRTRPTLTRTYHKVPADRLLILVPDQKAPETSLHLLKNWPYFKNVD